MSQSGSFWTFLPVWGLFLISGLLVGGAWSAYKNSYKIATGIMAVLAGVATAAAIALLLGEVG